MTWSYSGDPRTSTRDEVRFILQDTESTLPLISDQELDYLIEFWMPRYDSAYWVAAEGASIIARKFAGLVSVSADGVSVSVGDISGKYAELAKALRTAHQDAQNVGGEVDLANLMYDAELDPSIAPLNFSIGQDDNPYAGLQARGGHKSPGPQYGNEGWV